jgi:hypothetical protein
MPRQRVTRQETNEGADAPRAPAASFGSETAGRHWFGLEGASTIQTGDYLEARIAADYAVRDHAVCLIYGEAGLGKSYATSHAIQAHIDAGVSVTWVEYPHHTSMKGIAATLLTAITGYHVDGELRHIQPDLLEVLGEEDRLIVVDETQRLNHEAPPAPDDVALEAALLSIRGRRRMIHIARVLGWPRQRVEAAAEALTARLIHTGAVLENTDLGIQIRPRPGALDVELPTTDRVRDAKHARPLSTLEAAILLDAVQTGHISNRHIVANATRVAAGSLLKRGYLQPDDTGLHPSHDVSSTLTPTPSRRPRERKGKRP